eukprot:8433574-Lingulodinium_polyedra.AAC.1
MTFAAGSRRPDNNLGTRQQAQAPDSAYWQEADVRAHGHGEKEDGQETQASCRRRNCPGAA